MLETQNPMERDEISALANRLLDQEAAALQDLKESLDPSALKFAVEMILESRGMTMVVGAGTSSSLAERLAHLLTCSGIRAMALDAGQAEHGYSAIVFEQDVVIAFTRGGETDEVNHVLQVAGQRGARRIAITESPSSTSARLCDIVLCVHVAPEHDAGGVIPLASTLAHAALGDVLCATVLSQRGYGEQEFGALHPGGAVGKRLASAARRQEAVTPQDELSKLRGFILDLDGTLWQGETPLPGMASFFEVVGQLGLPYVLASNNPSQTPETFSQKAARMGVKVDPARILTSGVATTHYLRKHYAPRTQIHVVGNPPLKKMISDAGFMLADEDVRAVVVSLDREMNFETLKRATLLIRGGADFLGSNADPSYPTEEGIVPGSGTVVAALAASTDRQPIIMGKPEHWIFDLALEQMGLKPHQAASVGDRLDTDIAGGRKAGLKTILLLTGIATREDLSTSPIQPTWVFPSLQELSEALLRAHHDGA